ncbi:MAG: polyprenyl synthetase family protein [Heliobacteriaceae bacterium]|jgi:geranylgeranyl pyrophosphate synthase|nr:polyprenyl synthetase family protein [Heliobacteriaceae bacterium]
MKTPGFCENYTEISNLVSDDISKINEELTAAVSINEQAEKFISAPSKRIRPLLAVLFMRAQGREIRKEHYTFLSAIELIHNASLIHDDIIDGDETRRSQKTLNSELGNKLALITGDYLLSLAITKIGSLNNNQIINMLSKTMENMCLGEFSQYSKKFRPLTLEEYLLKTEQKTAGLFQAAIQGCEILSASEFSGFKASDFGIAFQIRNDLSGMQADRDRGIYNTPATRALLNEYIDKVLESINFLEDNEYKRAIEALSELLKYG